MNAYAAFLKLAIILVLTTTSIFSQSKVGTSIGQFLKIEPGARNAALGDAGAAIFGEIMAAYHNPASLGRLPETQLQFTHSNWLADIDYNYLTVGVPVRNLGTIMLQVTSLNSGEIEVRTVEQPLGTGERYSVTNFALGVGYGKMLTDRIAFGIQLNYLREAIWHSAISGFAMNFGVQYQLSEGGPVLGAAIANFGPRSGYNGRDLFLDYDFDPIKFGDNDQLPAQLRTDTYPLPTVFRVGLSFPVHFNEANQLLLAVDALHPNDNSEAINIGAEWQIAGNFYLRGGYRNLFLDQAEGGPVLGGGLQLAISSYQFAIDYAWADYGILQEAQRFTLGFYF